jgi:probable HAF family extracellular repeat protein
MKSRLLLAMVIFIFSVLSQVSFAVDADFRGLGYLPGSFPESEATGVSGDGSVVVGHCHNSQGFYWTIEDDMVGIGQCRPAGSSYDGSVIIGVTRDWEGFYWTENSGLIRIGDLPGGGFYSIASDVSYDGSVIVGQSKSSNGFEAFRWTNLTGMQGLGDLPGGGFDSRGFAVSLDGSIVVGQSNSASGREAFVWTELTGMIGLGALPGSRQSSAYGITEDGLIVVGRCYSGRDEAFMWTASTGMVGLGDLPGGSNSSWAKDVSADGSVVVGCSKTGIGWEAFIWDESNGMRNLKEVLENDFTLDLNGWTLTWANEISANGTVIVGRGYNPEGNREAWVATFSEPVIEAKVDIDPNTFNLHSKGKWITCYIWLPEDYDVADVNSYSVMFENEVEASWIWFDEEHEVVIAKFPRSEVQQLLVELDLLGEVEIAISGELVDGTIFEGSDIIHVINKSKKE